MDPNSRGCAFSMLNQRKPRNFCAEAVGVRVTFTWLKDTSVGCGTAAEVSGLNPLSCGNVCLTNPENWVTISAIFVM